MKITLDYENHCKMPWTIVATQNSKIIAAVCGKSLEEVQLKFKLLLIETLPENYDSVLQDNNPIIY